MERGLGRGADGKAFPWAAHEPYGVNYEAVEDGKVIGALFGGSFTCNNGILYSVEEVFIDPAYQGKGYGSQLIACVEDDLYQQGVDYIHLDTLPAEKTVGFYEKNGYTRNTKMARMRKSTEFDVIMRRIRKGLTGDYEQDMAFLDQAKEQYGSLEYGIEITDGIERVRCKAYPEEQEKAEKAEKRRTEEAKRVLKAAWEAFDGKDYEGAAGMCQEVIDKFSPLLRGNEHLEYFCFNSILRAMIYEASDESSDVKAGLSYIPFDELYVCAGYACYEMRRFDEAKHMFRMALAWNPVECELYLSYANLLGQMEDWEEGCDVAKLALEYADCRQEIGEAYLCMARFYGMQKDWQAAYGCCLLSGRYQSRQAVDEEMDYILAESGRDFEDYSEVSLLGAAVQNGIPLGPSQTVLTALMKTMRIMIEEGDREEAQLYVAMMYDLTNDDEYKKLYNDLKEEEA